MTYLFIDFSAWFGYSILYYIRVTLDTVSFTQRNTLRNNMEWACCLRAFRSHSKRSLQIADCYAAQERTSAELILGHGFHHRVIGLKHYPVFRSSKWFPDSRSSCAMGIRVESANEAGPITLYDRYNTGICSEVARRRTPVGIVRSPDSVQLDCVGYSEP